VQALGHADLVDTPSGQWWAVCLGIRPQGGRFHHIGRETYLVPVHWSKDNWPTIGDNGTLELQMTAPNLPPHPWPARPVRDNFDVPKLALEWNFLRNPREDDWSLAERPGFLRLTGSAVTPSDQDSPAFVGRRQTALACRATTRLEFEPLHENEEAGLIVRGNDQNHYDLGVMLRDGRRTAFLRRVLGGKTVEPVRFEALPPGEVTLSITARSLEHEFSFQVGGAAPVSLGTAATAHLSSEKIGGFTGAYFGMYATGNGKRATSPADFDWFDFEVVAR
jgi:alpha-N-arabinofuranosidase